MAPSFTLFARDDAAPGSNGLSTTVIAGLVVVGAAAVGLAILLAVICIRRRKAKDADVEQSEKAPRSVEVQPPIDREPLPADLQAIKSGGSSLGRSVSRRNLTPSIILPSPVPPVPAARPRPPKTLSPPTMPGAGLNRPLSSAEIVAHHQATGTTPRAFAPLPASSAGPFSFALNASPTRPSFSHSHSANSSLDVPGGGRNSTVSFSRLSILSGSLRSSSLRNSVSSASTGALGAGGAEALKVRQMFTPLLPDELVLRLSEKVTVIQAFDDGWSVVGRKSAFAHKPPASPAAYAFGQGKNARTSTDEVEIGAVPSWVFDKRAAAKPERPMRSTSLGITLVLNEGERGPGGGVREDVISWSNF